MGSLARCLRDDLPDCRAATVYDRRHLIARTRAGAMIVSCNLSFLSCLLCSSSTSSRADCHRDVTRSVCAGRPAGFGSRADSSENERSKPLSRLLVLLLLLLRRRRRLLLLPLHLSLLTRVRERAPAAVLSATFAHISPARGLYICRSLNRRKLDSRDSAAAAAAACAISIYVYAILARRGKYMNERDREGRESCKGFFACRCNMCACISKTASERWSKLFLLLWELLPCTAHEFTLNLTRTGTNIYIHTHVSVCTYM